MKLFFALLLCLPLFVSAQLTSENDYLKATWLSGTSVSQTVTITNKQSCSVVIQLKQGVYDTTYVVNGGTTQTVMFNKPFVSGVSVVVKGLSICNANGNTGNITVVGNMYTLPIKFNSISSRVINNNSVEVIFDVAEVSGVNRINVQLSLDGRTYVTRTVVFPITTQANNIYKIKFKL